MTYNPMSGFSAWCLDNASYPFEIQNTQPNNAFRVVNPTVPYFTNKGVPKSTYIDK